MREWRTVKRRERRAPLLRSVGRLPPQIQRKKVAHSLGQGLSGSTCSGRGRAGVAGTCLGSGLEGCGVEGRGPGIIAGCGIEGLGPGIVGLGVKGCGCTCETNCGELEINVFMVFIWLFEWYVE